MEFMACQGKGQRIGLDWLPDIATIWNIKENILKCGEEEGEGGETALVDLAAWAAAKKGFKSIQRPLEDPTGRSILIEVLLVKDRMGKGYFKSRIFWEKNCNYP